MNVRSPVKIDPITNNAIGNVRIPSQGKINVNPVISPSDEKNSGTGTIRSSYSSMLSFTNLRGRMVLEVVP